MLNKITTLLKHSFWILRHEGMGMFLKKLRQWISNMRTSNISEKPQTLGLIDEAQEIALGGERVTHLYPNDLYYAHLSIYWFASQFIKDKVVLDAGCGDGYGTHYLAEHGAKRIVGIDISKVAINACKKNFTRGNLRYQVVDLSRIDRVDTLAEHSVDIVFSSNALEHVAPVKHFFDKCHEFLTPDGLFIMAVPPVVDQVSRDANISNPYHLNIWTPAQWRHVLSLYFDDIKCYTHSPKSSSVKLDFMNSPEKTEVRENDFEFRQVPMEYFYDPPRASLTILFLASKPKSAPALPKDLEGIPMIDDSFTRELSLS